MQPRIISIHNAWNASLEIFSSNIHLSVTNIHTNASRCRWCRDVLKVITFQLRDILIRISMCLEGLGVLGPSPTLFAGPLPSKHLGGKGWVVAAHTVVMDTLRVQLCLSRGSTFFRHHSPRLSIVVNLPGTQIRKIFFCHSKNCF